MRRSFATSGAVGPGLWGTGLGRKRFPGLPATPWTLGQPTVPARPPRTWRGGRLLCWGKCASFCISMLIARARRGWGDAGGPAAPCRAPAVLLHVPRRSVYTTLTCRAARLSALSRRSWRLRSPDPAAAHSSHPRGAASGHLPPGPGPPVRNGCGRCLAQSRPTAVSRVPPSHNTHKSAEDQAQPWRRQAPAPRS